MMMPRRPRSSHFPYTTLFRSLMLASQEQPLELAVVEALGLLEEAVPFVQPHSHPQRYSLHPVLVQLRVEDRKSTRLNSSHVSISYAVLCLKKQSNIGSLLTRL